MGVRPVETGSPQQPRHRGTHQRGGEASAQGGDASP